MDPPETFWLKMRGHDAYQECPMPLLVGAPTIHIDIITVMTIMITITITIKIASMTIIILADCLTACQNQPRHATTSSGATKSAHSASMAKTAKS